MTIQALSLFYQGPGGVGKSRTTRVIIKALEDIHGSDFYHKVAITGSTGIAASHIGGE